MGWPNSSNTPISSLETHMHWYGVCLAEWQCLKCFEAPGIMLKECLREEQEGITLLTGHQAILSLPITAEDIRAYVRSH